MPRWIALAQTANAMRSFTEWFRAAPNTLALPWILLGKGPSFSKRAVLAMERYNTLGLNHVVREQAVRVSHIIDLDVVDACAQALEANAEILVMPWFPHVNNRPGRASLEQLAQTHPILRRLSGEDRLVWYNLVTAPVAKPGYPIIRVTYFSVEAALNLLVSVGVRQIRSLGIDGGASYSGEFNDLNETTLLANRRSSFDRQFEEIARTIMESGVDYAPLDLQSPIRVFVATAEAQMLAVKVLEYSIRRHASMTVKVTPMHEAGLEIPTPRDAKNRPRTPFSFQRFLIPALAEYAGRAIYLDSDMQVFRDIRMLWSLPFDGADLLAVREPEATGRPPQFSVMLLDCAELRWDIHAIIAALDRGEITYEQLMYEMRVARKIRPGIAPQWNSLERFEEGHTALLHYTDMDRQPWISRVNPLAHLWMKELRAAVTTGFIPLSYVAEHVARGFVRPSIMYQLEHDVDDPLLLPKVAGSLDRNFVPPYEALGIPRTRPWTNPIHMLRAALRHLYERTPLHRLQRSMKNRLSK